MQPAGPAPKKDPRYRSTTPLVHDDGSPIPAEWGLHCPHCDYDLTGLPHRRCPECGRRFDPHEIWVANRHKAAGVGRHTPAYVCYGVLIVFFALIAPLVPGRPLMLVPIAFLPFLELGALFLNRSVASVRPILIALAAVASLIIRAC